MSTNYEVQPDQFNDAIIISMIAPDAGDFIIALSDIKSSKFVRMAGAEVREGNNKILLQGLQELPPSDYLVTISRNDGEDLYQIPLTKKP